MRQVDLFAAARACAEVKMCPEEYKNICPDNHDPEHLQTLRQARVDADRQCWEESGEVNAEGKKILTNCRFVPANSLRHISGNCPKVNLLRPTGKKECTQLHNLDKHRDLYVAIDDQTKHCVLANPDSFEQVEKCHTW